MQDIDRRQFLDRSKRTALGMAAGAAALGGQESSAADQPARRPTVVCIYYPHWHNYDHGSAWKGEGWTEWEGVKAAPARFEGHPQPIVPTLGYFDESDPKCVAREIDLAADHGIDVFLYDWYWYSGVQTMQEALEQGFLKAANRDRMKFALMWANHDRRDQFCPEFGKERTVWLPSRHWSRDVERVVDYGIEHYFRQPNYWQVDGRLFFSVFQPKHFVTQLGGPEKTRKLLARMDDRLARAGLPPLHMNAMVSRTADAALAKEAGFLSTSRYNVATAGKVRPDLTEDYQDVVEAHRKHWANMAENGPLVDMPVATTGWDVTPRCRADVPWPFPVSPLSGRHDYPYGHVVVGSTPERFEQLLRDLAQHVQKDPKQPFAVLLNAWNEWTEGCFLLPDRRDGTAKLEAVRKAFGVKG